MKICPSNVGRGTVAENRRCGMVVVEGEEFCTVHLKARGYGRCQSCGRWYLARRHDACEHCGAIATSTAAGPRIVDFEKRNRT